MLFAVWLLYLKSIYEGFPFSQIKHGILLQAVTDCRLDFAKPLVRHSLKLYNED